MVGRDSKLDNIEILEKLVERCKECKFACCEQCEINWKEVQAIENLIKENKELKEELKFTKSQIPIDKIFYYSYKDFISKDKVKEKIEELEKQAEEVKNHYKGTYACLDEYLNAKSKIQGFKELLEEGE